MNIRPETEAEKCCGCSHGGIQPPTHFIGIGGAGMSAIARVLHAAGCQVQGSDRAESRVVEALRARSIPVFVGHDARNINGMERVVYTRAVPADNAELAAARQEGLEVIERAEMLGRLYSLFDQRVSVTGTHGKTSTSAMLSAILVKSEMDPTVLIGGEVADLGGNSRLGLSSMIVSEACEAYGSFWHLRSSLALVTNVGDDHLDFYGDFDGVKAGFTRFLGLVDPDGVIVACADDAPLMSLCGKVDRRWVTYGTEPSADFLLTNTSSREGEKMSVKGPDVDIRLKLPLHGAHFALNATGAIAAAALLGCTDWDSAASALESFQGVGRRMERKGEAAGVVVIDDYAHHPVEVEASLKGARLLAGGRLIVVFQPHLYTRTAEHLSDFAQALLPADMLVLTNTYAAREMPEQGKQADALADEIRAKGHPDVHYVPDLPDVAAWLQERVREGDTVITMGAGDVNVAGEELLALLGEEQ